MKVVLLDGHTINPGDLSWEPIAEQCELTTYERTPNELLVERLEGAGGLFVSKCPITADVMDACPDLKFIGVTATGYDNIDIEAAKARGIAVANNPAYSTDAVAQHVFGLILELAIHIGEHAESVRRGEWHESEYFCYTVRPLFLLNGKSIGIVGYGNIGKAVAKIAEAFGMTVNIYSRDRKACMESDIVTLHCPLIPENKGFVNRDFISEMKDGAILINTARGGLVNSRDVADALESGKLSGAGIDVLLPEPPAADEPLIGAKNCIVTPHIAWMPKETRQKVIDMSAANLRSFIQGDRLNRIV